MSSFEAVVAVFFDMFKGISTGTCTNSSVFTMTRSAFCSRGGRGHVMLLCSDLPTVKVIIAPVKACN